MNENELLGAAKIRVRKSGEDKLDDDVKRLIEVARADLARIGVNDSWLKNPEDPIILEAILNYVKANYSIGADYERLNRCYEMTITKIKGCSKYFEQNTESEEADGSSN